MTILTNQTTVRSAPIRDAGQISETDPGLIIGEEVVIASPYGNNKKKNKQRKPALLPTEGRRNFELEAKKPKVGIERLIEKTEKNSAEASVSSSTSTSSSSNESSDFSYSTLTGSGVALSILAIIDAMNTQLEASVFKKQQALSMVDAQFSAAEKSSRFTRESAEKDRDMAYVEATKQFTSAGLTLGATAGSLGYGGYQGMGKGGKSELTTNMHNQNSHLGSLSGIESKNAGMVFSKQPLPAASDTAATALRGRQQSLIDGTDTRLNAAPDSPEAKSVAKDYEMLGTADQQTVRDRVIDNAKRYENRVSDITTDTNQKTQQFNLIKDLATQTSGGVFELQRGDLQFEKGAIDAEKVMVDLAMRTAGESASQYMQGSTENDRQALEAISLLRQMQQANEVRG